jgi:hypothetical protein
VGPRELTGQQIILEDVMRLAISVRNDAPAQEALQVMLDNNVPSTDVVHSCWCAYGRVDASTPTQRTCLPRPVAHAVSQ